MVTTKYAYRPKNTTVVTCDCGKCNGITARVPAEMLAQSTAHKLVVLATQPYGAAAGCEVVSR